MQSSAFMQIYSFPGLAKIVDTTLTKKFYYLDLGALTHRQGVENYIHVSAYIRSKSNARCM